jgi:serine-threonine kinase receptor-associated protein
VWSAKVSNDAGKAVSASADFTAWAYPFLSFSIAYFLSKLWDTYTGEALETLPHEHIVRSVDISSSQTIIATGGNEKKLRTFDLAHACKSRDVGHHDGIIKSVVWGRSDSSDTTIVTSGDDKKVIWWDTRSPVAVAEFTTDDMITSMEQSVDANIITVTAGKTVRVFDSTSYKPQFYFHTC